MTHPRRMPGLALLVALTLLLLGGTVVYPSLVLLAQAFRRDGVPSLANFVALVTDGDAVRVLANSLFVSALATALATVLGGILALIIARTDLPAKGMFRRMVMVPYLIPPFIGALAWLYLLGPAGFVNQVYMAWSGKGEPLFRIYGPAGIVLAMGVYGYPLAYLVILSALEGMDPALEEAARASGARPLRLVRDVTIPLAAPSVAAAAVLVFLSSMADFGIPAVLGFPAKYFVLTTRIYATILDYTQPNNLQTAAALSMPLVLVGIGAMGAERWLLRGKGYAASGGGGGPAIYRLGRLRPWALSAIIAFVALTAVAPLLAVLGTALTRAYGLPLSWENLSLQNFRTIFFHLPAVWRALRNSLFLAGLAATIGVGFALFIGYLEVRTKVRGRGVLEGLVTIPFAVPGTVVALSMILAFLRPIPVLGLRLYNTLWIILVAYVARFLALALKPITAALRQVHASLEEAARASGAGLLRTIRDVTLPLVRSGVFAGWFLAAVPALTELTLSVLLWSVGNETVGVLVFNLHEEGKVLLSAALATVVTALALLGNGLARVLSRGQVGF